MEQVLCDARPLCLPVKPQTSRAVMNMVPADLHINSRMHLDAADLRAGQILLIVDVVDLIVLDNREHAAQMADNAGLSAVVDIIAANDMGADSLLRPPLILCLHDVVTLCLRTVLCVLRRPLIVIVRLQIFAKRDAAATGI